MFSFISLKNVILLENVSSCLRPGSHTVRLVGGQNHCEGTLEGKYQREWRPLYDIWSLLSQQNFAHLCEQVGCADVISHSRNYQERNVPSWELSSRCDGPSFCKDWSGSGSHTITNVKCSGNLSVIFLRPLLVMMIFIQHKIKIEFTQMLHF